MKKFTTLLLALVMIMSLTIPATAASITINPPATDEGTETGITYTAYKIFDATITYKDDNSIEGVAYTISKDSLYYDTVNNSGYFTLTPSAGDANTYVVTKKDNYTDDNANTFADTLKAVEVTDADEEYAGTLTKQANETYKRDGLADGYYLVTSSVGSDLILDTIGNITVNTKNAYPSQDKKVEGKDDYTTADMGEVLTFTIDVTIPEDAVDEIVVHDDMDGVEYVSMTAVEGITAASATLGDDCEVHFTLSKDYVAANKGNTITITYTAKVTKDVANNVSWLVDDTYTSKTDEVKVYSTDIVIDKYDGSNKNTKLDGAQFVLKNGENKFYKVDADGNVTWVDAQADATVVTTDDNGAAEFANIADGTYYLVETKAPTGYNLLTEPEEVVVAAVFSDGAVTDIVSEVENNAGTELPSTGGIGTTMFYIFGAIMMVGAAVLLVTKKRMAAAE